MVCEIKPKVSEIEPRVLDIIKEKKIENAVTIISFDTEALKNVRKLDKDIITMCLKGAAREKVDGKTVYHPIPNSILDEAEALDADAINVHYKGVTPEIIEAAHKRDFKVYCYTVNSSDEAKSLTLYLRYHSSNAASD